jgi:hypothetical protein
MRYSLEHKAQNHENILSVATRSFREHGGDSSGIGTVMKKVGLTKGASTGILRARTTCSLLKSEFFCPKRVLSYSFQEAERYQTKSKG